MQTAVLIVHILLAIALIVLALLQHGKGADAGAAFGSGASNTMFGARGSANFLSRATAIFATVFFLTSLTLTYFSSHRIKPAGVMESHSLVQPAVPADAAKQVVPVVPAQGGAAGSKAGEIPK